MNVGLIVCAISVFGFIGFLIWLIIRIVQWDSKWPAILGMVGCLLLFLGSAIFLMPKPADSLPKDNRPSNTDRSERPGKAEEQKNDEEAPVEFTIPDPVMYSGNGDDVITIAPYDDVFVFHITGNQAEHHFAVKGYDSAGEMTDLFVNTTSQYEGITLDPTQETVTLEVKATGDWAIEVQSINAMETISSGETKTGSGDSIMIVRNHGNTASISGNAGEHHFAVKAFGREHDKLLVNTTEVYDGTVMLTGDPFLLSIDSEGEWSITLG